jgi:FlaA1/EpsC-like NDP-sugar epimerase
VTRSPVRSGVGLVIGKTVPFGGSMVRRPLQNHVDVFRILSRDELKADCMRLALNDPGMRSHLGDCRDRATRLSISPDMTFTDPVARIASTCGAT